MYKSIVYEGDKPLGEVEVYPQNKDYYYQNQNKDIRISHFSQPSERCSPLAVLYTISARDASSSRGLCFKIETKSQSKELYLLHSSCIGDKKVYSKANMTLIFKVIIVGLIDYIPLKNLTSKFEENRLIVFLISREPLIIFGYVIDEHVDSDRIGVTKECPC